MWCFLFCSKVSYYKDILPQSNEGGGRMIAFLCKIGLHLSLCGDGAMFTRISSCNYCGADVGTKREIEELNRERELWSQVPKGLDPLQSMRWVHDRLNGAKSA
jgi:hypothetical protein